MKTIAVAAVVAALVALAAQTSPTTSPTQDVVAVKAADVKWAEAKGHPKGVQSCVVHGDPAKGAFVLLMKAPEKAAWPPHLHSADEVVFVQSGSLTIGTGEKVDESKAMTVDAGGYFLFKAKTPHWAKVSKETVFLRYANGPGDVTYVNPADDPSKK